nr:hypothetical protein BaRGS_002659 [Batillaria attramentaria]
MHDNALVVVVLTYTMEQDQLMKEYISQVTKASSPKTVPPTGNDPVKVQVSYTLMAVSDVNRNGYVDTVGYLSQEWTDPRLKFNRVSRKLRQNNITQIRLDPDAIWMPDVQLINSGNSRVEVLNHGPGVSAVVYEKGYVSYNPTVAVRSLCDVIGQLPQSYVNCTLRFMSWAYDASLVDIQAGRADLSYFSVTGPWNVTDFSVERIERTFDCCPDVAYPEVRFNFTIRGRFYYSG